MPGSFGQRYPVFMLTRDRLECVRDLTVWLELAGCEHIVYLDSGSTYEPMREWLRNSPHTVHWLSNDRPEAHSLLWTSGLLPGGPFAHMAPDVLPVGECPLDALDHCWALLQRYQDFDMAGLGIEYEDLAVAPGRAGIAGTIGEETRAELLRQEKFELEPGLCDSELDHTFCVYRRSAGPNAMRALRTKRPSPYMIRHVPFYEQPPFGPDVEHYIAHARRGNDWSTWLTQEALCATTR